MIRKHILWCKEGKHDKVWGIICLQKPTYGDVLPRTTITSGKFLTFWGRRGAKLQSLLWEGSNYQAGEMATKKLNKGGYIEIDQDKLDQVYPEFQQDLEKLAIWESLKI